MKKYDKLSGDGGGRFTFPPAPQAPVTGEGRVPGYPVQGRQSNHGAWWRPDSLSYLPPMPLYLAAAHWSVQAGTPLTGRIVCEIFRIEPRRALEVLRYLLHGQSPVQAERLPGHLLRVRVVSVPVTLSSAGGVAPRRAKPAGLVPAMRPLPAPGRELAHAELLRWFLNRPAVTGRR